MFCNIKSKTAKTTLRTPHWIEFTEGFKLLDFKSYIIWKYAGTLIAYPYVDDNVSQNEKQKLYITWKNENSDIHIFEKMLKESELDSENFHNILRTSNSISIEEENGKIIVQFTGDARYNINKYVYSPSLLKNAQEYIKSTLQRKEIFEDKDIEFRY